MDEIFAEKVVTPITRIADALDSLVEILRPLQRAANAIPNQQDRIMEQVFSTILINAGTVPTIATSQELTESLMTFFKDTHFNGSK